MHVLEIHCPHCSARLRVRDLMFVGRTIDCPDCKRPVTIVRNGAGTVACIAADRNAGSDKSASPPAKHATTPTANSRAPTRSPAHRPTHSGRLFGWAAGGIVLAALAAAAFFRSEETPPLQRDTPDQQPDVPAVGDAARPPEPLPPDKSRAAVQSRMQTLGEWATEYHRKHGVFPTVNPLARVVERDRGLGWLADLAADQQPDGPLPLWDRPYDDPLNSRFVRRRMTPFLNPEFAAHDAAEGFPAGHFIGMAGVGADAADLAKDHPRAGVFGWDRSTSVEDIRDGTSHVILIVGARDGFRPWAAGGRGTIRGLTQEPYVNGPDGLGTGQPDGMYVAMADGKRSLRFRHVSPVVLRRMAAMADGFPLDETVPGEPGATTPRPPELAGDPPLPPGPPPAMAAGDAGRQLDDRPIDVPVVRELPPQPDYDVDRALSQSILRFSQVRPAKVADLLRQIEELAAVPVSIEGVAQGPAASRLERPVSLELHNTTVRGILDALVEKAGLAYETGREFGIRVKSED